MVGMPLTDVVKPRVFVLGRVKKGSQRLYYLFHQSRKSCESAAFSLNRDLLYLERVNINMFCH
jgi:hypothetical protein